MSPDPALYASGEEPRVGDRVHPVDGASAEWTVNEVWDLATDTFGPGGAEVALLVTVIRRADGLELVSRAP